MDKILSSSEGGFSRSNQYQVWITNGWGKSADGLSTPFLKHVENYYGLKWDNQLQEKLAIYCTNANLPSSTYATGEVKDNYIGLGQEFAHTRVNTDIDFTFYLDTNYEILTFFEAWIDYISGTGISQAENVGYYRRFSYPNLYKNQTGVWIRKFEKNWATPGARSMSYQLINTFPKSITSIPLQYGDAEVVKVSVTMNYDRYRVYRESNSLTPPLLGSDTNSVPGKDPSVPNPNTAGVIKNIGGTKIPQDNFKANQ